MKQYRKTAVIVGSLFIIGTVSGILGGVLQNPIFAGSTYPLNISASEASETQWNIGTLLILLMGFPLAMLPVVLYPIFKKHNEVLALGAILFRGGLEAVCYMGLVVCKFLLLTLSRINAEPGGAETTTLQTLGSMLIAADEWIQLLLAIVFTLGALMIYALFYQTRLVPRWLSGWGFIGAVLYFIAPIVSILGSQHLAVSLDSGLGPLLIPLALQEMVFAVWLIVKGFNPSAVTALSKIGTPQME